MSPPQTINHLSGLDTCEIEESVSPHLIAAVNLPVPTDRKMGMEIGIGDDDPKTAENFIFLVNFLS